MSDTVRQKAEAALAEVEAINSLLKYTGALVEPVQDHTAIKLIRLEILLSALKCHGYNYGNLPVVEKYPTMDFLTLDTQSIRMLNLFALKT